MAQHLVLFPVLWLYCSDGPSWRTMIDMYIHCQMLSDPKFIYLDGITIITILVIASIITSCFLTTFMLDDLYQVISQPPCMQVTTNIWSAVNIKQYLLLTTSSTIPFSILFTDLVSTFDVSAWLVYLIMIWHRSNVTCQHPNSQSVAHWQAIQKGGPTGQQ